MNDVQLEPALAERLERIYKLAKPPATLGELGELFRERQREPGVEAYFDRVRRGEAVIGGCDQPTAYANILAEGAVRVMCGYDALVNALLRGSGIARGRCGHCGEDMEVAVTGREITRLSSPRMVFWLGAGPIGASGNPVCDHLHLFPDETHLHAWLETMPQELGVTLSIHDAVAFFAEATIPPRFAREGANDEVE